MVKEESSCLTNSNQFNTTSLTYASTALASTGSSYELTGKNRGLKTAATFTLPDGSGGNKTWNETYEYNDARDYLTKFTTDDGQPAGVQTWSYDEAGNRSGATYDALNRMSARGSISYTNDILGNRTSNTYSGVTNNFTWDVLNRLTSYTSNTNATWSYEYRADGMRTRKAGVGTGTVETLYLHDGQMPIEEATYSWSATRGNYSEIVRNGFGARGIDVMERVKTGTGAGTFYSYPVYDGHGNMIATLSKNGTGFSFGNQRAFDPWGTVRMWLSGGYAGFPSGRYCASIGHQMDDESGLVYMRARYYEAGSGRFISEDPEMQGSNWFAYCGNNPVSRIDNSGRSFVDDWINANMTLIGVASFGVAMICFTYASIYVSSKRPDSIIQGVRAATIGLFCLWLSDGCADYNKLVQIGVGLIVAKFQLDAAIILSACQAGSYTAAAKAVQDLSNRSLYLMAFMAIMELEALLL